MKVLVTGATGFVGRHLIPALQVSGHEVRACSRAGGIGESASFFPSPELGPDADWRAALQDIEYVVHLAGLAHAPARRPSPEAEETYRRINAEGTRALARQAMQAGVRHFVFLSSCHAIASRSESIVSAETLPRPDSAYGRSKLAAEQAVRAEMKGGSCQWTILRPPLVYGAGNKTNFRMLIRLVESGLPLPFATVRNRRSFVFIRNLADAVSRCLGNTQTFGKIFFPSDGKDVSTPELIRLLVGARCATFEKVTKPPARLIPFPSAILETVGGFPGLGALGKLTSSLYVDSKTLRDDLSWIPPFTIEQGLQETLAAKHK